MKELVAFKLWGQLRICESSCPNQF